MKFELGIIGAGNMAEAIARGVIASGLLRPSQIIAADVAEPRRELFRTTLQVQAVTENEAAARDSRVVLLSVKPQQMAAALATLGRAMPAQTLVISIAAGISSAYIEQHLGNAAAWRVVRTMPNTPMLVGEGMVALARGSYATTEDLATARRIFESAAKVVEVPEHLMDAVTAVSGSGPAYVFYLAEQMIRAAVELGLSPEQARLLAAQTALGAARMLAAGVEPPEDLRRKVTSPGGTTQAAITHLEEQQVGEAIVEAIKRAARRSKELGM